jgi:hypothetical protein
MRKYIECTNKKQMAAMLFYLFSIEYSYKHPNKIITTFDDFCKTFINDYFDYPIIVFDDLANNYFRIYNDCYDTSECTKLTLEEFFSLKKPFLTWRFNGDIVVITKDILNEIKIMTEEAEKYFS